MQEPLPRASGTTAPGTPTSASPNRRQALLAGLALAGVSGTAAARAESEPARQPARQEEQVELPGRTAHTRFAVNVEMWWTRLPFLERVHAAASLGFPAIEFWPHRGKDLDALAELKEELGLDIAQFTAWGFERALNDPANHTAFEEAVEEAARVAKRLDIPMATVVAGNDRPGVSKEEMLEQVTVGLRRAAPIAEREGLTLILEPMNGRVDHPGHCLYGSADALAICRAVDSSRVKINWDLYHMQITEGDLCGHLAEGFDQIGYVQLADHPGRNEPGTGEIHYPRVLRALHELGYRDYVGLECRPHRGELEAARAVARADRW